MAQLCITVGELRKHAGEQLGSSEWHEITQHQVSQFADGTGDHQWIHIDPERAKDGPFGQTIAHGFLTLSLGTMLLWEVLEVTGASLIVSYGLNKVRFPSPLPVGRRVRASFELASVEEVRGGYQAVVAATFEREGGEKPVCVAELLYRYLT